MIFNINCILKGKTGMKANIGLAAIAAAAAMTAQAKVDRAYRDAAAWNRMSLVNIARSGRFSSDRAILEYARDIWHVQPVDFNA